MNDPQSTIHDPQSAIEVAAPPPLQGRPIGDRGDGEATAPPDTDSALRTQQSALDEAPPPKKRNPVLRVLGAIIAARWLLAIPAVIIALYAGTRVEAARSSGSEMFMGGPPLITWQLFGLAGLLLAIAALPARKLELALPSAFLRNLRAMKYRWVFGVLLVASVACGAASIPFFTQLNTYTATQPELAAQNWWANNGSWLLFAASLVLFGLAFIIWELNASHASESPEEPFGRDRLPRLVEWAIMLVLFAVAAWLRVSDLENLPPGLWYDEANNGLVAMGFMAPNGAHLPFVGGFTQLGGLYFYFLGLLIEMFGNSIFVLRIIPALSGALAVPLVYMFCARLYGWRAGVAAAGFVAIGAWHITFSRFGLVSIVTVTTDIAAFLCLVQGVRTGRLGYFAAGGVLLGVGLHMYYPARVALIVLAAVLVHRLIFERLKLIKALRAGVPVFVLGLLLATIPISLFALQYPDLYTDRIQEASIFGAIGSDGNAEAFNISLQRHALMFNWRGDGNGRHNLPGYPMLDWVTAALFVAGMAACVLRFWRWQYFMPIVWFIGSISGGVLTLLFEAPQSNRTVENSLVTPLVAGIFLGEAWRVLTGEAIAARISRLVGAVRGRLRRVNYGLAEPRPARGLLYAGWLVSVLGILAVLWWAGGINYNRFFEVQANDLSVWKDMGSREKAAAIATRRYGGDYDVYVVPIVKGLPPSEYLAPNVQTIDWPGAHVLPLSTGKSSGAIIMLDLASAGDVSYIARMYPNATFEIHTTPSTPEPLLYIIKIPAEDIEAAHGVRAAMYEPGASEPKAEKLLDGFSYDWSASEVKSGTVSLSSTLKIDQYGVYKFNWSNDSQGDGPGASELLVDGYPISSGQGITLVSGLHTLVATDTVTSEAGVSRLLWSPLGSGELPVASSNLFDPQKVRPQGLTGLVRANTTFDSEPSLGRVDPFISFYFHVTPLPRPYTIEWKGKLYIPEAGRYILGTEQLSNSRLLVDGVEQIVNMNINNLQEVAFDFTAGFHDIHIYFTDGGNSSHMYLYWTPPGKGRTLIPSAFLFPEMGQYPDPNSAGMPTLADADGSVLPQDRVIKGSGRSDGSPERYSPPPEAAQPPPPVPGGVDAPPAVPVKGDKLETSLIIGDKGDALARPKSVAGDKAGNIYIYTESDSKIHKFDPGGKLLTSWEVKDEAGKPVTEGSALVAQEDGVALLDAGSSDLVRYSSSGELAGRMKLCVCFFPRGMAPSNDGNYWVANTGSNSLLKVSPTGQGMSSFGEKGDAPDRFNEPAGVAEAPDGTLYVADVGNKRVQSFDASLTPLAQWDMGNSIARDGNRLVSDPAGNVLVTQYDARAIVRYDKSGKELNRWVHHRGGEALVPAGIAALGGGKFVALYPEAGLAAVFAVE